MNSYIYKLSFQDLYDISVYNKIDTKSITFVSDFFYNKLKETPKIHITLPIKTKRGFMSNSGSSSGIPLPFKYFPYIPLQPTNGKESYPNPEDIKIKYDLFVDTIKNYENNAEYSYIYNLSYNFDVKLIEIMNTLLLVKEPLPFNFKLMNEYPDIRDLIMDYCNKGPVTDN